MGSSSKQPAARKGDTDTGHPGAGPTAIISGSGNVKINGLPAARKGDQLQPHHRGTRVIVEGAGSVKINGRAAVRITDAVNCGGTIAAGSGNVKIGDNPVLQPREEVVFPKQRGGAAPVRTRTSFIPPVLTADAPVRYEAPAAEAVPADSKVVTLTSTFARDQLFLLAQKDSLAMFINVVLSTFTSRAGEPAIPAAAIEALYRDAQQQAGILTVTHQAKEWFEGQGGFYSPSQQVWVYEDTVRNAALPNGNQRRGLLMTLLIEEYGHYIDWLLRNHYSSIGGDSIGDEGARFSYRMYQLNPIEQASQHFADAIVDGAPVPLIWDFSALHNHLKGYVNQQRQQREDRQGNLEFFKAGVLNKKGIYGHGDIEEKGLTKVFASYINERYVRQTIDTIYFGNWLRDFSQAIDPMIIRPMAYGIAGAADGEQPVTELSQHDTATITLPEIKLPEGGLLAKLNPFNYALKPVYHTYEFRPVMLSVEAMTTVVEMAATQEFIHAKMPKTGAPHADSEHVLNYQEYLTKLRTDYIAVETKSLGVYRPEEHIDNPKGLGHTKTGGDRGDKAIYDAFVGFVPDDDPQHDIGRTYGMKRYIRSDDAKFPTAYEYIREKLTAAGVKGGGFDNAQRLIDFGAALHTLEDYFAHTNYAEVALIKSVEASVFPWIDEVKETGFIYDYAALFDIKTGRYRKEAGSDKYIILDTPGKIKPGSHPLATYIPIVTGTFGSVDTAASVLPVLNEHVFSLEIKPWQKAKSGERNFNDILIRELLKDIDNAQSDNYKSTGTNDNSYIRSYDALLVVRDAIADTVDWLVPDEIEKGFHWLFQRIGALFSFLPYVTAKHTADILNDAQLLLDKDLELLENFDELEAKTFSLGVDPSHTQVAKDDPHNPTHELAAELAIEAVRQVGEAMAEVWNGTGNLQTVLAIVDTLMRHPVESDWQEKIVTNWAHHNRHKLCAALTPSAVIESLFHLQEEIDAVLADITKNLPKITEEVVGVINSYFDTNLEIKNDSKALSNAIEAAKEMAKGHRARIEALRKKWDHKYGKPAYCGFGSGAHGHHGHGGFGIYAGHNHAHDHSAGPTHTYHIQQGDTLSGIALRGNTTVAELKQLNGLSSNDIFAGDTLIVPHPVTARTPAPEITLKPPFKG